MLPKAFWMLAAMLLAAARMGAPMTKEPEMEFAKADLGGFMADRVRIAGAQSYAVLLASQTTPEVPVGAETKFYALPFFPKGSKGRMITEVHQLVPAEPAWDVRTSEHGLQFVMERPGGAVNALNLVSEAGKVDPVTEAFPFKHFSKPRFVKHAASDPPLITAVVDNKTCAVLKAGEADFLRELGACSDGLLVQIPNGFLFVYKVDRPGPVRGRLNFPGRLYYRVLNTKLEPNGEATLVTEENVFEFDGCTMEGRLAVLGTTESGVVIAEANLTQRSIAFTTSRFTTADALMSPAVAVRTGQLVVAALHEAAGKPEVLTSAIAFP